MHLNTRLMKAQYRDKAGSKQVGFKSKTYERTAEKKVKTQRNGLFARLLLRFGLKMFTVKTVEERWMEKTIQPRFKRGGSKLGLKLFKSQCRAVAAVQRRQQLGQRVSSSAIMRTGMPLRLRDLRGAS